MGGKSTLHSAVLKDDTQSQSSRFDLRSWQGLTEVLKVAKEFLVEPGEYASFRNLVLQYAQQGGDVEIKKKIDSIIASFEKSTKEKVEEKTIEAKDESTKKAVDVVVSVQQETSIPTGSIGGGRRIKPSFGRMVVTGEKNVPAPEPLVISAAQKKPDTAPVPEDKILVEDEPSIESSEVSNNEVTLDTVIDTHTEPSIAEERDEKSVSQVPMQEPAAVAEEVVQQQPKSLEEYKARIAEIKRQVHDQIGNPVALMNANDGVGKKYMAALLAALKATGAGGSGNVGAAMHDLEVAYKALVGANSQDAEVSKLTENDVEEKKASEEVLKEVQNQPVSIPTQTPPIPEVSIEESYSPKNEPSLESKQSQAIPIDPVVEKEVIPDIPREPLQNAFQKSDDAISAVVSSVHKTKDERESDVTLASSLVRESDGYDKWSKDSKGEMQDAVERLLEQNEGRRQAMLDAKKGDLEHHGQQSELSAPGITSALNKLLQEWDIFSGSGFFGMGPDGLEHPLYMQLAPLSMGEVVAGRWEKADPKIIRSIKAYVDAWRHEQGVTYTINETFEHYLRRVVQRIQKSRSAPRAPVAHAE